MVTQKKLCNLLDDKFAVLSKAIENYLDEVSDLYDDCIEQKSAMTVTLFQLWAVMEIYTVHQFPLLKEYPPPFPPEVLDILQLSKYEDLARLQRYNNICKSVNHSVDSKLLRYSPIL
ncbi:hypothetical protein EYZ11_012645 [Aspergillus tanneri]|uniref:Uncharacterized protein n=1 Tax=Aspergillus tanneri TaxID=1220188 RepID=A0A4S3J1U4_9EURO|nr:hypothetical protein EYZ11_012645 [Aspergillus tanneri]